jgi:NADPH2:quinone reductase
MRAIQVTAYGGPDVLRVELVPDPVPGAGEVVVRVHAAGVNPVETYLRSGTYTRKPDLPWTPGTDAGGVIESVGAGVDRFKKGDHVFTTGSLTGTYAELALCKAAQVRLLPERLSFQQGAAIHVPYATATRALLQRAQAKRGETVFVHGATGGVGLAAVQIAHLVGCKVVGTGGTPAGLERVKAQGADLVLDHSVAGYLDSVFAERGPDVIVEMLANRNLDEDLRVAAKGARIVVIGSRGRIEIEPRRAMTRDVAVLGMSLPNTSEAEIDEIYAFLLPAFASGAFAPVVREEIPLAEAAKAHERVMAPGAGGKIVLVP